MQKTIWAFQVFLGFLLNPRVLKRKLARMERYNTRLDGKKRVLWFITWGSTGADYRPVSTLWIRYPNSLQECIRIPDISGAWELSTDTGTYDELGGQARTYFDRYVRPRIGESLATQALKVSHTGHTVTTSEVRDHPFTPGVREFYELTTTYSCSCHTGSGYAPAKYARFTTRQTTTRVQLKGERLLLLQNKRLWNISAGRLPQIELSTTTREGIRTLAWELADRKLNAGQRQALESHLSDSPELGELLNAIRFTDHLHYKGLSDFIRYAPARERRIALRHQGGVKKLIRKLAGNVPGEALKFLDSPAKVALAISMERSGLTSPDLKSRVLRHATTSDHASLSDFGWFVQAVGEKAAAQRLIDAMHREDVVHIGATQPMDTSTLLHHLSDAGRMYHCLTNAGQTPKLSGMSIREMHDQLARLQRRVMTVNQGLPSAADEQYAPLDQTIHCENYGLLQFRRARDTHELIEIGETLNNCVASYAAAALSGEVIIVVARDALGIPRLCLEIRGKSLCQYKLNHNGRPTTPPDLRTAQTYVQAARLRVTTSDLPDSAGQPPPVLPQHVPVGFGDDLPF